jgi:uncharacterized protein (TIGR03437 family)
VYVADSANNAVRSLIYGGYQLTIGAVANAASELTGPVSGGEVLVLYGSGLAPNGLAVNSVGPLGYFPTSLNDVSVNFGNYAAPILYTTTTQIAVVVPYEVSATTTQLFVQYQGEFSAPFPVTIAKATPGIFTSNLSGQGLAAAINVSTGAYNNAANPANAGDFVEIYLTGAGQTSPPGVDGQPYGGPAPCVLMSNITIGGMSVSPQYCGGVPSQIAGLTQINVPIPPGLPAGLVPISVTVGGVSTQPGVTIAVSGH